MGSLLRWVVNPEEDEVVEGEIGIFAFTARVDEHSDGCPREDGEDEKMCT